MVVITECSNKDRLCFLINLPKFFVPSNIFFKGSKGRVALVVGKVGIDNCVHNGFSLTDKNLYQTPFQYKLSTCDKQPENGTSKW